MKEADEKRIDVRLDPAYADVAVLRWQAFDGKQAILDGAGHRYADVVSARGEEYEVAAWHRPGQGRGWRRC